MVVAGDCALAGELGVGVVGGLAQRPACISSGRVAPSLTRSWAIPTCPEWPLKPSASSRPAAWAAAWTRPPVPGPPRRTCDPAERPLAAASFTVVACAALDPGRRCRPGLVGYLCLTMCRALGRDSTKQPACAARPVEQCCATSARYRHGAVQPAGLPGARRMRLLRSTPGKPETHSGASRVEHTRDAGRCGGSWCLAVAASPTGAGSRG